MKTSTAGKSALWGMSAAVLGMLLLGCASQGNGRPSATTAIEAEPGEPTAASTLRLALFNIRELSMEKILAEPPDPQLLAAARIVARVQPDVLVVQEIDWLSRDDREAVRTFRDRYLVPAGAPDYEHLFAAPSNTGELTGLDLDGDGHTATVADQGERRHGNDSFGYGVYPGQYAMAVLSRYPFEVDEVRTFREFLWRDLPDALLPTDFYSPAVQEIFRLSSKSHWDLPVIVGPADDPTTRLHLLISHPTPQGFDGEEDRNGRRNFDEIRLWAEYLDGSEWIVDDQGRPGGLPGEARFVVVGDLNARPNSAPVYWDRTAISQLLDHPRVQESGDFTRSLGALAGRASGPPEHWERATTGFGSGSRIDYLLPSHEVRIVDGGVWWPRGEDDPEGAADAELASDHRLVWLDLALAPRSDPAN